MNIKAFLSVGSPVIKTLPLAIFYVTEGCNLKCIMCSYREPRPNELSLTEIKELASQLTSFGLQHIVFSGGEPLMRRDFPEICAAFSSRGVKVTLLTNGLLLKKRFHEFTTRFSEIIVSIDGPDEEIHNGIRGITAFSQIVEGISHIRNLLPEQQISIRTVLQKKNYRSLGEMIRFAKNIGVNRISFLAADILSDSFGRFDAQVIQNQQDIILSEEEIAHFKQIIDDCASRFPSEFENGFISESPAKLRKLAQYYEALLSKIEFPPVLCNAPNVSVVIQSTGELLPCFFLPPFGTIRGKALPHVLNSDTIRKTRTAVAQLEPERCKSCVCSLYVSRRKALFDNF